MPTGTTTPSSPTFSGAPRLRTLLQKASVSIAQLEAIIDFTSGTVLATSLASNKADTQRKLAALLSIWQASKDDNFTIQKETLREACVRHSAYDPKNFVSNMRTTEWRGSKVFVDREGGWDVSQPGVDYVADVVKALLPKEV